MKRESSDTEYIQVAFYGRGQIKLQSATVLPIEICK